MFKIHKDEHKEANKNSFAALCLIFDFQKIKLYVVEWLNGHFNLSDQHIFQTCFTIKVYHQLGFQRIQFFISLWLLVTNKCSIKNENKNLKLPFSNMFMCLTAITLKSKTTTVELMMASALKIS